MLPPLVYVDETLKEQRFDASKNQLIALHFWATWCVPCVKELPEVDIAQKTYADKGFAVIAIALDGKNVEKVKAFYSENNIKHLNLYLDPDMVTFQKLKIGGLPTTIFVNSKGEMVKRYDKPIKWQSEEIEKLIEDNIK